jgi:hypothetical protein
MAASYGLTDVAREWQSRKVATSRSKNSARSPPGRGALLVPSPPQTVENHLSRVYGALGGRVRTELASMNQGEAPEFLPDDRRTTHSDRRRRHCRAHLGHGAERRGRETELIEQSPQWHATGRGLAVQPNAIRVLHALGLGAAIERAGAVIRHWDFCDQHGEVLSENDLASLWGDAGSLSA